MGLRKAGDRGGLAENAAFDLRWGGRLGKSRGQRLSREVRELGWDRRGRLGESG